MSIFSRVGKGHSLPQGHEGSISISRGLLDSPEPSQIEVPMRRIGGDLKGSRVHSDHVVKKGKVAVNWLGHPLLLTLVQLSEDIRASHCQSLECSKTISVSIRLV